MVVFKVENAQDAQLYHACLQDLNERYVTISILSFLLYILEQGQKIRIR